MPNRGHMIRDRTCERALFSFELDNVRWSTDRQPVVLIGRLLALPFFVLFEDAGHHPSNQRGDGWRRRQGQALRVLRSLDPGSIHHPSEEGGDAKGKLCFPFSNVVVHPRLHLTSVLGPSRRSCPSPEPAPNQPPMSTDCPSFGEVDVLNRTVRGNKLVSGTGDRFRDLLPPHHAEVEPEEVFGAGSFMLA